MAHPTTITAAIDAVVAEDPRRTRHEARAIAVSRWPQLRSPTKRAVQHEAPAGVTVIDQPKRPAPSSADVARIQADLDRARSSIAVLEQMVAERDARIADLNAKVLHLEGELEDVVVVDAPGDPNPPGDPGDPNPVARTRSPEPGRPPGPLTSDLSPSGNSPPMPTINEIGPRITLRAATAIAVYQLLTVNTDGEFAVCGVTDVPIAQALDSYDADALAGGRLPADGVLECKAAGTISAIGTPVYTAADGEVSATAANGAKLVGFALKAAVDHDIFPVIPFAALVGKPDLAAATYVAPSGGATQDAEARASLAQLAADFADLRAKLVAAGIATT